MKKDIFELKSKIEELYQNGGGFLYVDNGIIIRVKDNMVIVYDAYFRRGWMLADAEVIAAMVANWYLTQLMIAVRYDKPMILPNGSVFDPTKLEKSCPLLDSICGGLPEWHISMEEYQEAKKGGLVGVYHLLVEKYGDMGMWLPCDWEGEYDWELTADYFINDDDIPEDMK